MATPAGFRAILEDNNLQTVAFVSLLAGLAISTCGVVIQDAGLFRLGWAFWLFGLVTFLMGVFRLARTLRRVL